MSASLARLQTEREQLRALAAKQDYDAAHADTCAAEAVHAVASAARLLLLDRVAGLADWMLDAIEGETDETRVHYRMSDVAIDYLRGAGQGVQAVSGALPELGQAFGRGVLPRELLTVSQWADRHRWLKTGTNLPGQWRTDTVPYLREIMDSLSEHSHVRTVVLMKSSGVGGTECLYNWIGYVMHHLQNKDLLVVVPTLELRDRSFNPRLSKMIEETEALGAMANTASRNKANRADLMEYGAHARIIKSGANSPDSLRSDHLPYVICDEVDAFPWDVGGEGDPMTLIENRQRTFSRAKTFYVSTPTKEDLSRIERLYNRSDRRVYHVPCPECGHRQPLEFPLLKWESPKDLTQPEQQRRVTRVWYECAACQAMIEEGHKTEMLARGRWAAQRPSGEIRGYHINALYAPIGLGLNWREVADKWLACQGDTAEMKAFVNTYLGETWREQGDNIEHISLLSRVEEYPAGTPAADCRITAGVDVQKDRLECTVAAWGEKEECWVLDHHILPGDTAQGDVWDDLAETLTASAVHVACIDSGYNTSLVYSFCEKRRWAVPVKGLAGHGRPLVEDEVKRRQRLRARRSKRAVVEPLGVDQGKALLYARLKITEPGPGHFHFPRTAAFDDEYFAQVAAERLVTRMRGGRPFQEWVATRPRNEALDCLVYALAARRLAELRVQVAQAPSPRIGRGETNTGTPAMPPLGVAGRFQSHANFIPD